MLLFCLIHVICASNVVLITVQWAYNLSIFGEGFLKSLIVSVGDYEFLKLKKNVVKYITQKNALDETY